MPKYLSVVISIVLLSLFPFGKASAHYYINNGDTGTQAKSIVTDTNHPTQAVDGNGFVLQPILGLGVGMMSYYGNVKYVKGYAQNPTTARLGYTFTFAQKMSDHLEFNLYGLIGTLGQYERSPYYNWNFESQIAGGGFQFMYKFYPTKPVSIFVTLGVESFNFLSKTDMKDKYGNTYYYWTDGSIRNLPQNAPDASQAQILTPDYSYETDIRSLNLDGSGDYSHQTFAVPVGAGFMIHVTEKAQVTFGTTFHYTFTDHIDGLTPGVAGELKGTTYHDKFLLTSIGIRYDLTSARNLRGEYVDESRYDNAVLDASVLQDNVIPDTGKDIKQSDSAIAMQYKQYKDSTGKYVHMTYDSSGVKNGDLYGTQEYVVEIGKYSKGVSSKETDKILSIADVKSYSQKDSSTIYTAGSYDDYQLANIRKENLKAQGFKDAKVVLKRGNQIVDEDKSAGGATASVTPTSSEGGADKGTSSVSGTGGVVYRVQLGAFKHKLNGTKNFSAAKNVIEIKTENDYYTYSVGAFTNYQDAVAEKEQMKAKGYSDAFVKAYRNGKRITLAEAGVKHGQAEDMQPAPKPEKGQKAEKQQEAAPSSIDMNNVDKKEIKFKVQLGAYKGTPPAGMRAKFKKYKNLTFDEDANGLTHYNLGPYSSYAAAKAEKEKAISGGVKGAFVVAYYKDKQIPVKQAIDATK